MAFLIDTSVLVHLLRDRSGLLAPRYDVLVGTEDVFLSRVTEFELLKGVRDQNEWVRLVALLAGERLIECEARHWSAAARLIFDLRRRGTTLKNPIDALIAHAAIERNLTLVHDDHDFELFAAAFPLKVVRFSLIGP